MNTQYFCSPELSVKLQKLGVESQFDFWWVYTVRGYEFVYEKRKAFDYTMVAKNKPPQKTYHWSDLLLPDALKKVWGNIPYQKAMFLYMVECGGDWQSFLEEEVNRRLSEKV